MAIKWGSTATIFATLASIGCDAPREKRPVLHQPTVTAQTVPPPQIEIPTSTTIPAAAPTNQYSPLIFKGYVCTIDCSGHEAGYRWAEDNDIDDPDDCTGNSNSFIEGCRSYVEEQQGESSADEEEDEE